MGNGRGSLENTDFILVATLFCSKWSRTAQLGATVRLQNCIVCGARVWSFVGVVRMCICPLQTVGKSCWEEEGGELERVQSNSSLEDFFNPLKKKYEKIILS